MFSRRPPVMSRQFFTAVCSFLVLLAARGTITAQLPAPLVEMSFSETNGTSTTNSGSLGGTAIFAQAQGWPVFSTRVPGGPFAPSNNIAAVDFGTIGAGEGGRAIDLSSGTLGAFNAFTVAGWVNARDLAAGLGGNRIAFALAAPNGPGFDLVQLASGALRLGINQWPDGSGGGGPSSSSGKITADASVGAANWIFFAVTYNSALPDNHVKFYFGSAAQAATLDVERPYARGAIATSGDLTLGNFSSVASARNETGPSGGSRVFRGLIDEVRVFNQALSLADIQTVQRALPHRPVDAPPVITQIVPATNLLVRALTQVEVIFSEAVQGVDAADLVVAGTAAAELDIIAPDHYVFRFPEPATGAVTIAWAPAHGITDFAEPPNPFTGASWSYTLDPNAPGSVPFISEFLADNETGLRDDDGARSDWIELFNPGPDSVNLAGWSLTDDVTRLTKWRFPGVVLLPNQFLLVFASEKNRTNFAAPLHTNFKLEKNGEYLALVDPQTNVVSAFAPGFPAQGRDISYGRDRVSPEFTGYFATPTPGAPNATSGPGISPEVEFSHGSGHFTAPFQLTLAAPAANAVIRYILVNSAGSAANTNVPGTNSPIYSGPIAISNSVQVRARAFVPNFLPGEPSSETFVFLSTNLLATSSDLPIVVVHTLGGADFNTTTFNPAHLSIYEPVRGRATFTNQPATTTRAALRVRGNTSANSVKKSWTVELRDEFNADKDVSLLGMPAESDWVLYGPNNIEPVYIHNPFAFELARRMGQWAPRTRFVELYLNTTGGQLTPANYHGLYILTEKIKIADDRIDEPQLRPQHTNAPGVTGTYLLQVDRRESGESGVLIPPVLPNTLAGGGNAITYTEPREAEIRLPQRAAQQFYILDHLTNFVNTLNGPGFADPVNGYPKFVNIPPSIDNHLVKVLTFTVDAFNFSSYFYKPRNEKIVFGPIWDFDRALESNDHRDGDPRVWRSAVQEIFDFFNYSWWGRMFQDTNFWQVWVDRYQEVRGTVWSDAALFGLIDDLAAQVRESQARDVARWPGVTTPRGGSYQWEVDHMKEWLTNRVHFMDTNFLARPGLNTASRRITNSFLLEIAAPTTPAGSQVYFTIDGSDPRLPGGGISPAAQLYTGPVTITNNAHVVARSRNLNHRNLTGPANGNPPANTPWSGPVRALLVARDIPLAITEIMYHPAPPPAGNTNDADNFEYLELRNVGVSTLSLVGVHFTRGIDFAFAATNPVTQLAAGERIVLVKNRAAFLSRYPAVTNIAGEYGGNLANDGERLTLVGPLGEVILDFRYNDGWFPITDGVGFPLVIDDEFGFPETWAMGKEAWRVSGYEGGSPGTEDKPDPPNRPIWITEVLPFTAGIGDAIELFTPNSSGHVGGWYLTDDFRQPRKYRIPDGTVVPPGTYRVFYGSNSFGVGPNAFTLSPLGGEVYLFAADFEGRLTGMYDGGRYGPQFPGVSVGKLNGFTAQRSVTLGAANSGPRIGPIVVSEIHYRPPDIVYPGGSEDNTIDEFIELHNITTDPVMLFDPDYPTNTWRLRDAVQFRFPQAVSVAPGAHLLVVSFNPTNTALSNDFAMRFNVPPGTRIFGPSSGKLDNSGESVELVQPAAPLPASEPNAGFVPYVLTDRVEYSDTSPWNSVADGFGASLQRVNVDEFGNDFLNWTAAIPNPGSARPIGGTVPVITAHPQNAIVVGAQGTNLSVSATGDSLIFQWRANGANITGATNPVLALTNVQLSQAGTYSVAAFNSVGAALSSNATLTVLAPVTIVSQPLSQNVQSNANVTLSVSAVGNGTLFYQWSFHGTNLVGATNATLSLTNATLEHHGFYQVTVTDDISSTASAIAEIYVMIRPAIIVPPRPATVLQGQSHTLRVGAIGAPPLSYRWLRDNSTITSETAATLLLTNLQTTANYRVVVTNRAGSIASPPAPITVLADFDRDGMADVWEAAHGFNTNSVADALLDSDADGMINRDEYVAGTDPLDPLSLLKLAIAPISGASLEFTAQSNITYTVQFTTNPVVWSWQSLSNVDAGPLRRIEIPDPEATNRPATFYRIATPQE